MQAQFVSVSTTVASGQISVQEGAAPLSAGEAADPTSFEAMLDTQVQAMTSEAGADPDMLLNNDQLADPSATTDIVEPLEAAVAASDLGTLLASMLQAAPAQAMAIAGMAAKGGDGSVSKVAEAGVPIADNPLPIIGQDDNADAAGLPTSKIAEKIAGSGKELPLAGVKELPLMSGRLESAALRSADPAPIPSAVRPGAESVLVRTDIAPQASSVPANHQAVASVGIEPRVGVPGWDAALGQKVVWLANQHQQSASMQLNPPNLGPLEVKLSVTNDQASALFVSHHPAVRDAIEASLPRLREMLAESGINLGNVQVSAESFPREQGFDDRHGQGGRQSAGFDAATGMVAERSGVLHLPARGLVDIYA